MTVYSRHVIANRLNREYVVQDFGCHSFGLSGSDSEAARRSLPCCNWLWFAAKMGATSAHIARLPNLADCT